MNKIDKLILLKEYYCLKNEYDDLCLNINNKYKEFELQVDTNIHNTITNIDAILGNKSFYKILDDFCFLYDDYIYFENGNLIYKNQHTEIDEYDNNTYAFIALKNTKLLKQFVNKIINEENVVSNLMLLCKSYQTIRKIRLSLNKIKEELLSEFKLTCDIKVKELKKQKEEFENDNPFVLDNNQIDELIGRNKSCLSSIEKLSCEDYSFRNIIPIGNVSENVSDDLKQFVLNTFNHTMKNNGEEVCISPNKNENFVFVEVEDSYVERNTNEYYNLIYKWVISCLSEFDLSNIQFAFIENDNRTPVLSSIKSDLANINANLVYENTSYESDEQDKLLDDLLKTRKNRKTTLLSSRCANIKDYNNSDMSTPMSYIVLLISGYDIIGSNKNTYDKLLNLLNSSDTADTGIMILMLGENKDYDLGYDRFNKKLDLEDLKIKDISLNDEKLFYNEKVLETNNIYDNDINLSVDDILKIVKDKSLRSTVELSKKLIVDLPTLLEECAIKDKENPIPFEKRISIPISKFNNKIYSLEMDNDTLLPYVLVTGRSGTGKSAFLQSVLLSAVSKYSPEELEIYIVDFKSKEKSLDYDPYKYQKGVDNLYVPHIKYVSLKAKKENAFGVIELLKKMMDERSVIGDFKQYNSSEEVKSGRKKRMPFALFLIDEVKTMFNIGNSDNFETNFIKKEIEDGIKLILEKARVYGIGIIFSGQEPNHVSAEALKQIRKRIGFYHTSNDSYMQLFPSVSRYSVFNQFPKVADDSAESIKTIAGYAFYGEALSTNPAFIRMAYITTEAKYKLAKKIREKYKDYHIEQICIGSSEEIEINDSNKYKTFEELVNNKIEYESSKTVLSEKTKLELMEDYRKKMPIALGCSESTLIPTCIDFSTENDKTNFYAFAKDKVLNVIEQNSAIAFLYQMIHKGIKEECIIYCGSKNSFENCFRMFFNKAPYLEDYVVHIEDIKDISRYLVYLNENSNNKPKYIILDDVSWLKEDKLNEVLLKEKDVTVNEEHIDSDKDDEIAILTAINNKALKEGLITSEQYNDLCKALNETYKNFNQNYIEKVLKDKSNEITPNLVYKSLKELYLYGNKKEIFMLMTSADYTVINSIIENKIFSNDLESKKALIRSRGIYGTYKEVETKLIDEDDITNTCYLLSEKVNVRMYSYDNATKWWNDLYEQYKKI